MQQYITICIQMQQNSEKYLFFFSNPCMVEVLESYDRPELSLLRAKIWVWLLFPVSCNLIVNNPLRSFVILSEAQRTRRISATRYASLACPEHSRMGGICPHNNKNLKICVFGR